MRKSRRQRKASPRFCVRVGRDGMVRASFPSTDVGRIAQLRASRRWSTAELARRINAERNETGRITAEDIDSWEVGAVFPALNTVLALEPIFHKPFAEFMRRVTVSFRPEWLKAERRLLRFSVRETARLARLRPAELRALERGEFGGFPRLGQTVLRVLHAIGSSMPRVRDVHGAKGPERSRKSETRRVLRLVGATRTAASA